MEDQRREEEGEEGTLVISERPIRKFQRDGNGGSTVSQSGDLTSTLFLALGIGFLLCAGQGLLRYIVAKHRSHAGSKNQTGNLLSG